MKKVGLLVLTFVVLFSFIISVNFVSAACSDCGRSDDGGIYCSRDECYSKGDCSYLGRDDLTPKWSYCNDFYWSCAAGTCEDALPISDCTTLTVSNSRYLLITLA